MNKSVLRMNSSEMLFFLLFEIGTIANTYAIPGENRILRILLFVSGLPCLIKLFYDRYSKGQLCFIFSLFLISVGIYLKAAELSPFVTIVVLFVCKGIRLDWLIDITLYTKLFLIAVRLILIQTGLIQNNAVYFFRNGKYIIRYTFGYNALNVIQIQIIVITMLILYKMHTGNSVKKWAFGIIHIILLVANYIFYRHTASRTSFIVGVFIIFISLLAEQRFFSDVMCKATPWVMPGFMVLSYAGMLLYNRVPLVNKLDLALTGRLMYTNVMWRRFGLSLLGGDVSSTAIIYDNSYVRILLNLGLLYSTFIFVSMYQVTKIASKEKNLALLLLLIGYQFLSFAESIYGYVFSNLSLVLIETILYKDRKTLKYEKISYSIHPGI